MAALNEVFENFSNQNEQMEPEHEHSHAHSHEHSPEINEQNMDMSVNDEVMNDSNLVNENDLNQNMDMDIQDEMNDNIENDEIEVPDDENIESFDSNIVDSEIKEVNQQIDMHKILLFIGVPLAIIAILYFLVPMIRQRMNGSE
jgi:hypothetical protein